MYSDAAGDRCAAFAGQATTALEQAHLFTRLGAQNEEIARAARTRSPAQRRHSRHRLRPRARSCARRWRAADVTMNQALSGAYGELPERYRDMLRTALASNDDRAPYRRNAPARRAVRRPVRNRTCASTWIATRSRCGSPTSFGRSPKQKGSSFRASRARAAAGARRCRRRCGARSSISWRTRSMLRRRAARRRALCTRRGGRAAFVVEDDGYGVPEDRRDSSFSASADADIGRRYRPWSLHRAPDRGEAWWNRGICSAGAAREARSLSLLPVEAEADGRREHVASSSSRIMH